MKSEHTTTYRRYRYAALRFVAGGGLCCIFGLLFWSFLPAIPTELNLLLLLIGIVLVSLGSASLQKHNVVKAFAQQCICDPTNEIAQGLLEALQAQKHLYLVSSSIQLVDCAIQCYESAQGTDTTLVEQLRQTANHTIIRKKF